MRLGSLLRTLLAGGVVLTLMGHSPYRQWAVYRQTHLIVVADDSAPGALAASDAVARVLAAQVPHSHAVAAAARSATEVLKLLRSRQLPLGLLLAGDAADALLARGPFAREPPLAIRGLAAVGPYLLVALDDFPAGKAGEIARALLEHAPEGAPPVGPGAAPVPVHPGAAGLAATAPAGN
jgi:hypothetical protein